jgi:hypothetical protein
MLKTSGNNTRNAIGALPMSSKTRELKKNKGEKIPTDFPTTAGGLP